MKITSSANPKIKNIRKLQERKARSSSGLFFMEGLRIIGEAVEERIIIETLVISKELLTSEYGTRLVEEQQAAGTDVIEVNESVFRKLSSRQGPQGIAAVGRQRWVDLNRLPIGENNLWVALESVQDPGNLGTIIRTADATGCCGVILIDECTDPYDPSALRASMGAAFNLRLVKATLAEFTDWKNRTGIPIIGASDKAKIHYRDIEFPAALVLLMGSEREGLKAEHNRICDEIISIPMAGKSDSLNLAVATGVILYEYFEQWHRKK